MENVLLEVKDLALSYKTFKLSRITFSLKSGDILGLIGRSGAGKSTVIRALLGIKKPDMGNIVLTGEGRMLQLNEHVGYSPQQNALYPYLTIGENISVFGRLYGMRSHEIEERMIPLLQRLGLKEHLRKRINELSGGMQKRADLAVALIHKPNLIILDEPFNGIDISLQKFIWDLLKELASIGAIIIVSSHMLTDIQRCCNQFGLIENNTYYNTEQVRNAIIESREQSLESFIERLFSQVKK